MENRQDIYEEQEVSYSRRKREERRSDDFHVEERIPVSHFRLGLSHHMLLVLLSLILTGTTVVLPYMASLATDFQQFNLYTGLLMSQRQLPYSDVFSTAGFLFYGLIDLSQKLGNQLYLLPVQFMALYVAGVFLSKIILFYTNSQSSSRAGAIAFYLANVVLGFGGLYPMQWAAPFLLMGLWYLIRYFAGLTKDEGFVLYGINAALALFLEPRTLIFWVLAFLFLSGYNLYQGRIARGFYQNLAITLGLLLISYTIGYFIFTMEVFVPYVTQVITYNFTHLAWGTGVLWQTALLQLGLAFFSGLFLGVLVFIEHIRKAESDKLSRYLILFSLLIYVALALLAKSWAFYHLLPALPFGIILTIISLDGFVKQEAGRRNSHRSREDQSSVWGKFIYSHLAGPMILVIVAVALPFYQKIKETNLTNERAALVNYIGKNVSEPNLLLVDSKADIYLKTGLKSVTHYPVTSLYQASADRVKDFEDDFLSSRTDLVIVNKSSKLSETVKESLSKSYLDVTPDGLKHFSVYQSK